MAKNSGLGDLYATDVVVFDPLWEIILARKAQKQALEDELAQLKRSVDQMLHTINKTSASKENKKRRKKGSIKRDLLCKYGQIKEEKSLWNVLGSEFEVDESESKIVCRFPTPERCKETLPLLIILFSKRPGNGLFTVRMHELCFVINASEVKNFAGKELSRNDSIMCYRVIQSEVLNLIERESVKKALESDIYASKTVLSMQSRQRLSFLIPRFDMGIEGWETGGKLSLTILFVNDGVVELFFGGNTDDLTASMSDTLEDFKKDLRNNSVTAVDAVSRFLESCATLKDRYSLMERYVYA